MQYGLAQKQAVDQSCVGTVGANTPTPPKKAAEEIIKRLEHINCVLRDTCLGQNMLLERLNGSTPVKSDDGKCLPEPNSALALIDSRLNWVLEQALAISNNQQILDRLA